MKKFYLATVAILLATSSFAQNGTIQNGGFENWTDQTLYDYPTQWKNSNQQDFYGVPTIAKSTDAQAGTYSCEISVAEVGTDTTFGYVFHGGTGQNGPDSGIPYSDNFDEVRFQYKSDIASGDTLIIIVIRFNGGVMGQMEVVDAAFGTQANWTQGSATIPAGTQDSLFIGFVMGDPFGNESPDPASWARIDAVEMYNAGSPVTNVPDPGFEDWSTETVEVADNWYSLNEMLAPQGLENAIKTIDANTGTYAIEMTTILEPNFGDTMSSFISVGPIDFNAQGSPFIPAPYNATPTTISGAYKYTPANGDQAWVQVQFFAAGVPVGNHAEMISTAATWQTFTAPLTISSQPDSMIFLAFAGDNPGSVLKLDDLALSGGDVSLDEFASMNISMYPNPATSTVMIKAEGTYNYAIIDLAGNVVMTQNDVNGAIQLDINNLSSGSYFVKINNAVNAETHKLIVE
jgi:Secretion system C-terminal sorting domain